MSAGTSQTIDALDRAYALSLVELGDEQGVLDDLADEVDELAELLREQRELQRLLASHVLSVEQRAQVIERVFAGNVSDLLYRFIHVVNRKGRLAALGRMLDGFVEQMLKRRGLIEVDAFVATRMEQEQVDRVKSALGKALDGEVVLHQYVDEQLIGGLKLRVGDQLVDGSVATQLKMMRHKIIRQGRERARGEGMVEE